MIVFLAGMPRSGSTFAFNVARHVLERRGRVYQEPSSDIIGAIDRSGGAEHILLKAHDSGPVCLPLVRLGACRTICTVRRVEDAMASWMEAFDFSEQDSIENMKRWLALYKQVRGAALTISYTQIDRHPWLTAWRIARYLDAKARLHEAISIARRYTKAEVKRRTDNLERGDTNVRDIGFSYYDETTFFHRRHVSSLKSRPAEARLGQAQLERIRAVLSADVAEAGLS
jgi:hypothetical protein